jgi:hypothetical protein
MNAKEKISLEEIMGFLSSVKIMNEKIKYISEKGFNFLIENKLDESIDKKYSLEIIADICTFCKINKSAIIKFFNILEEMEEEKEDGEVDN